MVRYNPTFLDNTDVVSQEDLTKLTNLASKIDFNKLVSNSRIIEELGVDFIYTSAQIEGNTYDKFDTATLVKMGITAGGKKHSDAMMILNMRDAYNHISKTFNQEEVLTKDYIKDLHYLLADKLLDKKDLGTVRTDSVIIGGSSYIPLEGSNNLTEEFNYMVRQINKIDNVFSRAIYAHLNICYLQYFKDCNKRTARFYQNALLMNGESLPLIPYEDSVRKYKESIISYYETGNTNLYVQWFIDNYQRRVGHLTQEDPHLPKRGV